MQLGLLRLYLLLTCRAPIDSIIFFQSQSNVFSLSLLIRIFSPMTSTSSRPSPLPSLLFTHSHRGAVMRSRELLVTNRCSIVRSTMRPRIRPLGGAFGAHTKSLFWRARRSFSESGLHNLKSCHWNYGADQGQVLATWHGETRKGPGDDSLEMKFRFDSGEQYHPETSVSQIPN